MRRRAQIFPVNVAYGLAGRVWGPGGAPWSNVKVVLLDAGSRLVASAISDAFGLYRLDAVKPGTYRLQALRESSDGRREILAERPVEVRGDFLFSQDLRVAAHTTR